MKSSIRQASYFRSTGHKVLMAIACTSLIGGLSVSSALAEKDDGHGRGREHARGDRHGDHGRRPEHRGPYVYAQPVYVPPTVYVQPQPSPGVSLFLPLELRF